MWDFVLWILFLAAICSTGGAFLVLAIWWFATVPCRMCHKRLPADIRKHRVRCIFCSEWPLEPDQSDYPDFEREPQSTPGDCPRCAMPIGPNGISLWDQHWYCRDCVAACGPELLTLALRAQPLREIEPVRLGICAARAWLIGSFAIVLAFAGGMSLFLLAAGMRPLDAAGMLGVLLFIGIVPASVRATGGFLAGILFRPAAEVRAGEFVSFSGRVTVWPIAKCEWRGGELREKFDWPLNRVPGARLPVLFVKLRASSEDDPQIAVGYRDQSRRIWKAFLELSGLPKYVSRPAAAGRKPPTPHTSR
jgi:hypothetical protein